jgi:glucokinase
LKEFIIGFDLGGTFLKYGLGTLDGQVLCNSKKPSKADESREAIFGVFFECIEELQLEAEKRGGKIVGIGVGSPGAVDYDKGRLIGNTPNLPEWGNADLRGTIPSKYNIPLWADNDANVMVLAESREGAAKGRKNVIAITLGTGIGGGILINNDVYRGVNYAGAELGHVSVEFNGLPCDCGGQGCIEKYASAPAMIRNYIEKLTTSGKKAPSKVSTEVIFEQARNGSEEANATIDETCEYLGSFLASMVNVFNPEAIVIGGGVSHAGDEFIDRIKQSIHERAMKPNLVGLKVVQAQLGNDAGVVGAIHLAAESYIAEN